MKKYIDLIAVRPVGSGNTVLLVAEAHLVQEGNLVLYDCGKLGRVIGKAWAGEDGGEIHTLLNLVGHVYRVEAVYSESWREEVLSDAP